MSVEIDPTELAFKRPFTTEVSQILKIRNPNQMPIAFKVKTTAPKQYCVRPNSGRVEPGKEVEVTVLLQAMKQEPPLDAKCKDKFLVQSVGITADKEFTNTASIWTHVDNADKSAVQERKIKVVYLAAEGLGVASTPLRNNTNGISSHETPDVAPPSYSSNRSPSPEEHFTPDTRRDPGLKPEEDSSTRRTSTNQPAAILSNTAAAVANATPSYEELKTKLAEAQATISNYAQEGGVRLRKVAKGETSNQTINDVSQRVQQSQGVPLQIVAALCLMSFLLAYLFF